MKKIDIKKENIDKNDMQEEKSKDSNIKEDKSKNSNRKDNNGKNGNRKDSNSKDNNSKNGDGKDNNGKKINWNNIKTYMQARKIRREEILKRHQNSVFGQKMQPIYNILNKCSVILQILLIVKINFVIEWISRHSFMRAWDYMVKSPLVFLYNCLIIAIPFSVVYLIRRRVFARTIISVLWIMLGIANGYMLAKRVTPFNAQDLKVAQEGFSIALNYSSKMELFTLVMSFLAVLIGLIWMWRRCGRYEGKLNRKIVLVGIAIFGIGFAKISDIAIERRVISTYFGNIAFAYEDYGTPYCFVTSVFGTGISQPYEYSETEMKRIVNAGNLQEVSHEESVLPNIIFVQLESFFDTKEVRFLETSEDPLPNIRKLSKNYSSGYFRAPSIGAGTANTEFEVLTGMNLRFFGPGEYPYKTVLKNQPSESLATALSEFGYTAHAFHNNGGNFYSRAEVFNNLGFDSYSSREFMNIVEMTENGWAKDYILIEHIVDALEMTEGQDFIFGISVQGHGSYPEEPLLIDPIITVENMEDEKKRYAWEYYVNQIYEMDQFAADLVKAVEDRGEPAVIVFYGDHLPTMDLRTNDLKSLQLYNTNYVIWDNIGLEKIDRTIPAYQIGSEVLGRLGIYTGTIFNHHRERRDSKDYLLDLQSLQYDILYGKSYVYDGEFSFDYGKMQMGLRDTYLTEIELTPEEKYVLHGNHFTEASKVFVNGERVRTIFLDKTSLEIAGGALEENDIVHVSQVGSSNTVFRSSKEYVYYRGILTEMFKRTWSEK